MNVLMVVAAVNFRDEELLDPKDALEEAGHHVTLASVARGKCSGVKGFQVPATVALAKADAGDYGAVVFAGGEGARTLFDDPHAQRLAKQMIAQQKVVGAICIAPVILARAGVLVHRHVSVFPTERIEIAEAGAFPMSAPVTVDGNLITANGPAASMAFADALVTALAQRKAA
ncbi:MAG: DJ-1/PfpI family protein [Myxococcaceae bacterium]